MIETKNELVEIIKKLGENKLLPGTSGNVSIRYKENQILLTASGSSSAFITCDDIILTDFEGNLLEKTAKHPTSEIGIHTLIYKKRPDINAIIHSHSSALSAFAVVHKPLRHILAENIYYFKIYHLCHIFSQALMSLHQIRQFVLKIKMLTLVFCQTTVLS
ncbi:MAG: class II aldolase/adducin family protein [Candidatus Melainabacteria bacterium]|nr:MAG: class II aldolase/adducin family protein [Candidatus Melainabacteria bacterium]